MDKEQYQQPEIEWKTEIAINGIIYKNDHQQYQLYQEPQQMSACYRKWNDKPGKIYLIVKGAVMSKDEGGAREKITEQSP